MNYQMTKFKIEPRPNQEIISYDFWYDGMVHIIDMMVYHDVYHSSILYSFPYSIP